jgi:hypothetical protein
MTDTTTDIEVLDGEIVYSLADLADDINREHRAAHVTGREFVQHVWACGASLNTAKEQVPHGEWLRWLRANCPAIGERQAQRYMQFHRANPKSVSETDLEGGLRGWIATQAVALPPISMEEWIAHRQAVATAAMAPNRRKEAETAWPPYDREGFLNRLAEIQAQPQMVNNGHALSPEEQIAHRCGLALAGAEMAAEGFMDAVDGRTDGGITVQGLRLHPSLIDRAEDVLALLEPAVALLKSRMADAREAIER